MISIFILSVIMQLIIASPINRQNFTDRGTGCRSINAENYDRRKRDIIQDDYDRWEFPIHYYIEYNDFDYYDYFFLFVQNLLEAIKIIEENTCVKFKRSWIPIKDKQGLNFIYDHYSCSSNVGLIDPTKSQEIRLTADCYCHKAYILHEIGHALGLIHEQSRSDRDKYVNVKFDNINNKEHSNFRRFNFSTNKNYSTSYDFASIMHYHQNDFAVNKDEPVLTSKLNNAFNKMMGQRLKMTFNDFKKINLYHCNKCYWVDKDGKRNKTYKGTTCRNGSYPNYNNCNNKCICPIGYTGDLCQNIVSSSTECGKTTFYAEKFSQNLFFKDRMTCYIFIMTERRKKIKIKIHFSNTPRKTICTEDISNQIKYGKDKGNTGLLLCGLHNKKISLKSGSNSVLIIYRGSSQDSGLTLTYQQFNRNTNPKKS
uniref:Metalloendopeptidase n=1 Tax=Strongyloides papillosus TaxID=174720 RepID=A0A0N5B2C4_STREA